MRRLLLSLFAILIGIAPLTGASAAVVYPPGLRIGLEPAGELSVSRRFPGFEDAARQVAVTILDLPAAAYDQLSRSAFAPQTQELTDFKRESFQFAGGIGVLVSGTAQTGGAAVRRWFLIASAAPGMAGDLAMMIRVEVPQAALAVYSEEAVRKMLASVAFRTVPTEELLGMLPFKLGDLAGFRIMRVVPDGILVIDGQGDDMSTQSYALVSAGRGAPDNAADRARFARDLLTTAPLRDLELTSAEAMRIGGWPGFEIRGQAKGVKDENVKLVQWVRFVGAGGNFLRIVAVAPNDQWDAAFNRFRALRDGLELR